MSDQYKFDNLDPAHADRIAEKIVELVNAGEVKDGDVWLKISDPDGRVAEIKVVRGLFGRAKAAVTKNF